MSDTPLLQDIHRMVQELIQEAIKTQCTQDEVLQKYQESIAGWTAYNAYASGYAFGVLQTLLKGMVAHTEVCRVYQGNTYSCDQSSVRPLSMQLDPHVLIGGRVGIFWKKQKPTDPDRIWFMED